MHKVVSVLLPSDPSTCWNAQENRIRADLNNPYHAHVLTLSTPNHPSSQGFQKSAAILSQSAPLNESFAYHPSANRFWLGKQRSWFKTWRSVSRSVVISTRRLLLWTEWDHAAQMSTWRLLPPLPEWWVRSSPLHGELWPRGAQPFIPAHLRPTSSAVQCGFLVCFGFF